MLSPRVRTPGRSLLGTPARVAKNTPSSKIRVVCRVRPLLPTEEGESCLCITNGQDSELHVKNHTTGRAESYKLDYCYGEEVHISYIFKVELEPILPVLFRGCNATVFAYGATGSGKTHTMQGVGGEGLIPMSMMAILSVANAVEATVDVSFYEIYMDRCYDLLEPKATDICVLEDTDGHVQLRGLSQVQVRDMHNFQALFSQGCSRRKTGHTGLNDVSSRSHAVLTITVATGNVEDIDKLAVGKLNLIDLAGNEDNRRSGNEGVRLAESSRINQSLFALSNVINALNSNETRIPYRDSKLTRILQDSLGGTSCALMIACLNPGSFQEAVHTLNLAAKSRQITNKFMIESHSEVKIDMEAKLKAWREEKSRTCGKYPARVFSPVQNKGMSVLKEKSRSLHKSLILASKLSGSVHVDEAHLTSSFPSADQESVAEESCKGKENMAPTSPFSAGSKSSPLSMKLRGLGSALHQALSPLSCNTLATSATKDSTSPVYDSDCLPETQTPLEKLKFTSRNVQETLIKEYVEVLNKGDREELLALKGIGAKRADYILKLRETESSPIKELQDLQKIGLSKKLACTLFNGNIVRQIWATPK